MNVRRGLLCVPADRPVGQVDSPAPSPSSRRSLFSRCMASRYDSSARFQSEMSRRVSIAPISLPSRSERGEALPPEVPAAPAAERGDGGLKVEGLPEPAHSRVGAREFLRREIDEVDEDRESPLELHEGAPVVARAHHLLPPDAGQGLQGPVPRDDLPLAVHDEGRIGHELDRLLELAAAQFERLLGLPPLGDINDREEDTEELPVVIECHARPISGR